MDDDELTLDELQLLISMAEGYVQSAKMATAWSQKAKTVERERRDLVRKLQRIAEKRA